jgi:hypothetical protein
MQGVHHRSETSRNKISEEIDSTRITQDGLGKIPKSEIFEVFRGGVRGLNHPVQSSSGIIATGIP